MAHKTNNGKKKVCFCLKSVFNILDCHISVYKFGAVSYILEKQVNSA